MTMALSRTMLMVISILGIALIGCNSEKLHPEFYVETCPEALPTILKEVKLAIAQERRIGASLLRLFFHDCFVRGCDGSVLLDDTFTMLGEKNAAPNRNSLRGFDVVDNIKAAVERVCPGVVSCADILAIAARDSVSELGGPRWGVKLGRRDSLTASQAAANASIPPPTLNLTGLINSFQSHGLSTQDMIALSGSHTIGQTKCSSIRAHIYNDTNIDRNFAATRQAGCPKRPGMGDNLIAPLDLETPTKFDNSYFKNLMEKKGILHSDQELYNKNIADPLVRVYAYDQEAFFTQFAEAMIKMGDIKPLTGHEGQVRRHCRRKNVNGL